MTPEQRLKEIEDELAKIEEEAKGLIKRDREIPMERFANLFQYWIWLIFIRENENSKNVYQNPVETNR